VGGELKDILTKDEIKIMLDGFADSMQDKVLHQKLLQCCTFLQ
jgi:hypothetical protein